MKTTKEKISVMQAFADGKSIQFYNKTRKDDWTTTSDPVWDWNTYDYRIKPKPKEPTYRPYQSVDELVEDYKARFHVDNPPYMMPLIWVRDTTDGTILFYNYYSDGNDFKGEYTDYIYLDGTPFGKLVEECVMY